MNMVTLIETKRDNRTLTTNEIDWFVREYTAGTVPDYQASALLMAIYLNGMTRRETVDLTMAMARSGDMLDLSDVAPFVVDKHSSGGVGDKTTLVVAPLVAACGVPVGKMSGRGLGITGGTLDKMEAIHGWSSALTVEQFKQQLGDIGFVLAGQSADLAPADGKLYALRDVTGTVSSIPLIAASIMSKKLASGANSIVLDVKVGQGAFMKTIKEARQLAQTMVDIGNDSGRRTVALLTNMNQPLGHTVGNALEVEEAVATLQRGKAADDFWEHCLLIASWMLVVAGKAESVETAAQQITTARDSGAGLAKFWEMVQAQGGDPAVPFKQAAHIEPIYAPRAGWVSAIDAREVGLAAIELGGGRKVKTDTIDHAVGFRLTAKVGDVTAANQQIGTIHANDAGQIDGARDVILNGITWQDTAVEPPVHLYDVVGA